MATGSVKPPPWRVEIELPPGPTGSNPVPRPNPAHVAAQVELVIALLKLQESAFYEVSDAIVKDQRAAARKRYLEVVEP